MDQWLQTWTGPISTVILVIVTGWYAWLTRSLAKSAKESAKSAEVAALAAERSASISVASADVRFEISPAYSVDERGEAIGVTIRGCGATVYLHDARIENAHRSIGRHPDGDGESFEPIIRRAMQLVPFDPETLLPTRVHREETVDFIIDPPTPNPKSQAGIAMMEATVWYSFDGVGPVIPRSCSWRGTIGADYVDPGEVSLTERS